MSSVEIRPVTGIAVEPWLDELAKLRIEVFRDFPYLYEGDLAYERRYLDRYAQSDQSVFVLALEFNKADILVQAGRGGDRFTAARGR